MLSSPASCIVRWNASESLHSRLWRARQRLCRTPRAPPIAAHLIAPGHAGFEFYSDIWIGPFEPSATPYNYVEQLAALLARAGLQVVPLQDARGWQWTKLVFNSAVNPVGALTQLHLGAANRLPPTAALYAPILQEAEAVA